MAGWPRTNAPASKNTSWIPECLDRLKPPSVFGRVETDRSRRGSPGTAVRPAKNRWRPPCLQPPPWLPPLFPSYSWQGGVAARRELDVARAAAGQHRLSRNKARTEPSATSP
jgi:hypothetical protein